MIAQICFSHRIGSFIFTLPHFLSGPYISLANPEQKPLCMPVGNVTKDVLSQKHVVSLSAPEGVNNSRITNHCAVKPKMYNHMYLVIMCIANMCLSVGSTPLYTIVISYFYANLPKQDSPIYFGKLSCSKLNPFSYILLINIKVYLITEKPLKYKKLSTRSHSTLPQQSYYFELYKLPPFPNLQRSTTPQP